MRSRLPLLFTGFLAAMLTAACTPTTPPPSVTVSSSSMAHSSGQVSGREVTLRWNTTMAENENGNLETTVRLEIGGAVQRTLDLGTYVSGDVGEWPDPIPGAVTVRHLWFGGVGELIGVFHEGDALIIRLQPIGAEEELPWETLATVPLPQSTPVIVLSDEASS